MKEIVPENPSNIVFEPTISILKNALLINYKKVGTRYFNELSSFPNKIEQNRKQLDFQIMKSCDFSDESNDLTQKICKYSALDYRFKTYHCYTPFDMNKYFGYNNDLSYFSEFDSTPKLLSYLECDNYNEMFFENKTRKIVFIVRNPILRFISGLTQIASANMEFFANDSKLREELKFYTKLEDSNIKNVIRFSNLASPDSDSNLEKESLHKILKFIAEKRWDWIFQDIHTENYLSNYVELIYNIKNKNNINIVDLADCRSDKSLEYFSELRGDSDLKKIWKDFDRHRESNKKLYQFFLDNYVNNREEYSSSPMSVYLRNEYETYQSLINSPYFVDLSD